MRSRLEPGDIFLFFCGMMVLQLIWVRPMVPETKGVPLEQMMDRLNGRVAAARGGEPFGPRTGGDTM